MPAFCLARVRGPVGADPWRCVSAAPACSSASTAIAPSTIITASRWRPRSVECVLSLITPMSSGIAKPARLPTELMNAMPIAAAVPPSREVGLLQKMGGADMMPIAAMVMPAIASMASAWNATPISRPTARTTHATAVCQRYRGGGRRCAPSGTSRRCRTPTAPRPEADPQRVGDAQALDDRGQPERHPVQARHDREVDERDSQTLPSDSTLAGCRRTCATPRRRCRARSGRAPPA